jgi:hypothetical protein
VVSGITQYHSGNPFTVFLEDPGTKIGWLATWMDRVPGSLYEGRQSGHDTVSGIQWFNTAAFAPLNPGPGAMPLRTSYLVLGSDSGTLA